MRGVSPSPGTRGHCSTPDEGDTQGGRGEEGGVRGRGKRGAGDSFDNLTMICDSTPSPHPPGCSTLSCTPPAHSRCTFSCQPRPLCAPPSGRAPPPGPPGQGKVDTPPMPRSLGGEEEEGKEEEGRERRRGERGGGEREEEGRERRRGERGGGEREEEGRGRDIKR